MKATVLLIDNKVTPTPLGVLISFIKKETKTKYNHACIKLEYDNGEIQIIEAQDQVRPYTYEEWLNRCERNEVLEIPAEIESIHLYRLIMCIGRKYEVGVYFRWLFRIFEKASPKTIYCFELIQLVWLEKFKEHNGIVTANEIIKYMK